MLNGVEEIVDCQNDVKDSSENDILVLSLLSVKGLSALTSKKGRNCIN